MEREKLKSALWVITYTVALVLVVIRIEDILYGVGVFLGLLRPLLLGIVIAFVLDHPYERLRGWYQRRWGLRNKRAKICAVVSVYVLALGAITALIGIVAPEVARNLMAFAASADSYLLEVQSGINAVTDALGLSRIDLTELIALVNGYLRDLTQALSGLLPQIVEVTAGVVSALATFFLALALSIYIMSGKERLLSQVKRCLRVYLPKRFFRPLSGFMSTVYQVFDNYVAGQCKEAVILGVLCFLGMTVMRLDYAGMVSVVVGVTALVPILGAYIGGAVGVILLLFVSPGKAVAFLIFLIVLQQVEGNVIYPRVVGRKIGLPGMWVLLAIGVGGGLWGIWGMLIGVPLTTVLYQLLRQTVHDRERALNLQQKNGE